MYTTYVGVTFVFVTRCSLLSSSSSGGGGGDACDEDDLREIIVMMVMTPIPPFLSTHPLSVSVMVHRHPSILSSCHHLFIV